MLRLFALFFMVIAISCLGWVGWTHRDAVQALFAGTDAPAASPAPAPAEQMAVKDDADTASHADLPPASSEPPAPAVAPPQDTGSDAAVALERAAEAAIARADRDAQNAAEAQANADAHQAAQVALRFRLAPMLNDAAFETRLIRNVLAQDDVATPAPAHDASAAQMTAALTALRRELITILDAADAAGTPPDQTLTLIEGALR